MSMISSSSSSRQLQQHQQFVCPAMLVSSWLVSYIFQVQLPQRAAQSHSNSWETVLSVAVITPCALWHLGHSFTTPTVAR
eukprot:jgi/Chrzof1/10284/Cz04g35180.t1